MLAEKLRQGSPPEKGKIQLLSILACVELVKYVYRSMRTDGCGNLVANVVL